MYAIVDFKGQQLRAEKDRTLKVAYLADKEIGAAVEIDRILVLQDEDNEIYIGQPIVENAKVLAEVVRHFKDKKVIVFKKKKRKGYSKKQGHRQNYTELKIKDIVK